MGRPRLYNTPEEKKATDCRKSSRYYRKNSEAIKTQCRGQRLQKKCSTAEPSTSAASEPSNPAPKKSELELLSDRVSSLLRRFGRLTGGLARTHYLTEVIQEYEGSSYKSDLTGAKETIEGKINGINQIQEALAKYKRLILNVEGVGKVFKKAEELETRMKTYEAGLSEVWEGALVDPAQLLVDIRRGRLQFLK
ncbi:hypothetical protein DFP72DRAFT_856720 [Ephemerocybe angulata]|uniref:Uncharacterized protein n=1 Tax=Ephemerocybe angulata TaxID=980116 RepID=A0A8H6LYF2_9AGAR|nr:hypothetical protein DFP72DRAFT_856720 [Tulosesus angulatus]